MLKSEKRPIPINIFNVINRTFGIGTQLDFDNIIRKARRNTGLDDLGNDFNETSLRKIIFSANEEANLHPFGVLMFKEKLISQLENRLWAEHWFKKYPEILEQELLPVILITGLQRTGTTKMQRLLSGLADARALLSWEALYPAPVGSPEETKKRIGRTIRNEKAVKWISPAFNAIHPIHTHEPEEDVLLLDVHFMSSSVEAILNVPGYSAWLSEQNHEEAYQYELKLLKLMQWQRDGKFWVLKSPHHLEYLETIQKVFPELEIIWMHRQIEDCIPSFFSMLYYSRSLFTKYVDKTAIVDQWLGKLEAMLQAGLDFREAFPVKIHDVFFDDFMSSEHTVVQKIMDNIPFLTDQIWYANKKSNDKYVSKHQYYLEDWDLNLNDLKEQFTFYHQKIFQLNRTPSNE